jgi:hypothetical protein
MEEYKYQGRIAICSPRPLDDFNQHGISAVLIADGRQPLLSNSKEWENIQCEIIIRPIRRLGEFKIPNARLDHVAQALGDESQWIKNAK